MKVAFRQANHEKSAVKDSLPENWVTEHCSFEDQLPDHCTSEDGWQVLEKEEFDALFAKCNSQENYDAWQKVLFDEKMKLHLERQNQNK